MSWTLRGRTAATAALFALSCLATATASGQGEAESLSASFRKAARRVLPAVVTVRPLDVSPHFPRIPANPPFRLAPPDVPPREVGGSGVVIDADKGFVLTNDHVVQDAPRVAVILHDGRERTASQVRRDPKSDLALLVLDGRAPAQAEWGDSEALDTGDWVLAVGQPFGLSDTVTAGIVSGKGRGIGMAMYEDLIQTDAAINPGNSGGPLVNMKGEVIGINTALKTFGGGNDGVGFAIPGWRARRVASDLIEHGKVRRAYLGLRVGPVDHETASRLDQPGAVVVNMIAADGPAAEAGFRLGDVIVGVGGRSLRGPGALQAAVEFAAIGEPLSLTIDRSGGRLDVEVRPREQPETFGLPDSPPPAGPRPASRAGARRPEGAADRTGGGPAAIRRAQALMRCSDYPGFA
jgi:serine protease Do